MKVKFITAAGLMAVIWMVSCTKPGNPSQYIMSKVDFDFLVKANTTMNNQVYVNSFIIDSSHFRYPDGTSLNTAITSYTFPTYSDHKLEHKQLMQLVGTFLHEAADTLPDADHIALVNQLKTLSGHAFDSVYTVSQIKDHNNMVDLFTFEGNFGVNDTLKAYAGAFLNTELTHQNSYINILKSKVLP